MYRPENICRAVLIMKCRHKSKNVALILIALGLGLLIALFCSPAVLVVLAGLALIIIGGTLLFR